MVFVIEKFYANMATWICRYTKTFLFTPILVTLFLLSGCHAFIPVPLSFWLVFLDCPPEMPTAFPTSYHGMNVSSLQFNADFDPLSVLSPTHSPSNQDRKKFEQFFDARSIYPYVSLYGKQDDANLLDTNTREFVRRTIDFIEYNLTITDSGRIHHVSASRGGRMVMCVYTEIQIRMSIPTCANADMCSCTWCYGDLVDPQSPYAPVNRLVTLMFSHDWASKSKIE
jgi:hypothetical protein